MKKLILLVIGLSFLSAAQAKYNAVCTQINDWKIQRSAPGTNAANSKFIMNIFYLSRSHQLEKYDLGSTPCASANDQAWKQVCNKASSSMGINLKVDFQYPGSGANINQIPVLQLQVSKAKIKQTLNCS